MVGLVVEAVREEGGTTQLVFTVVNLRRNPANKPENTTNTQNREDLCSLRVKLGQRMNRQTHTHSPHIKARRGRK